MNRSTEEAGEGPEDSPQTKAPDEKPIGPQVWFMTDGLSPVAISLTRKLLAKGDSVILGVAPNEANGPRSDGLKTLVDEVDEAADNEDDEDVTETGDGQEDEENDYDEDEPRKWTSKKGWTERFRVLPFDARSTAQAQSTIAEAVEIFGHLDVLLLCQCEIVVGTVEELSVDSRTRSLVSEQFETNFFGPVTVIKQVLPVMRKRREGHIIVLSGTTGHLGTPGLAMYCSAQWALEGYCDSLAYEIAPFNIRLTILQPNIEVSLLTNRIIACPPLQAYSPKSGNRAPLAREIISRLLSKTSSLPSSHPSSSTSGQLQNFKLDSPLGITLHAQLPRSLQEKLIAETIHAIYSVGGIQNPPARLIVGYEGIASVKEKLRTVMEELEDFLAVSEGVDIVPRGTAGQTHGRDQDEDMLDLED